MTKSDIETFAGPLHSRKETVALCKQLCNRLNPEWALELWKKFRLFVRGSLRKSDWDKFVHMSFRRDEVSIGLFNEFIRAIIYNAQKDIQPPFGSAESPDTPSSFSVEKLRQSTLLALSSGQFGEYSVPEQRFSAKQKLLALPAEEQQRILSCLYPGIGTDDFLSGKTQALLPLRQPSLPFAFPENEPPNLMDSMPETCVQSGDLHSRTELAKRFGFYVAQHGLAPQVDSECLDFVTIALEMYLKQFLGALLSRSTGVRQIMRSVARVAERAKATRSAKASENGAADKSGERRVSDSEDLDTLRSGSKRQRAYTGKKRYRTRSRAASPEPQVVERAKSPSSTPALRAKPVETPKRASLASAAESLPAIDTKPVPPLFLDAAVPPRTHIFSSFALPPEISSKNVYWDNSWSTGFRAGASGQSKSAVPRHDVLRVDMSGTSTEIISLAGFQQVQKPGDAHSSVQQSPISVASPLSQSLPGSAKPKPGKQKKVAQSSRRDIKRKPFSIEDVLFAAEISPKQFWTTPGQRSMYEGLILKSKR